MELFNCLSHPNTRVTTNTCKKRAARAKFILTHPRQIKNTMMTEYDCIACAECAHGLGARVEVVRKRQGDVYQGEGYIIHYPTALLSETRPTRA